MTYETIVVRFSVNKSSLDKAVGNVPAASLASSMTKLLRGYFEDDIDASFEIIGDKK